jgi:hypothetical protein
MLNSGGKNGSVRIISNTTGSQVRVSFPPDPGPPPVPAHEDAYDPVPDWALRRFEHAMPPLRVDVTVDAAGAPTLVDAHS